MIRSWERQPKESIEAFTAFSIYRDLGTVRSLKKVAQQLKKSEALMGRWSGRWSWVERAAEWDREQDRVRRAAYLQSIEKMSERQASQAGLLAQELLRPAMAFAKRMREAEQRGEDPFDGISNKELLSLMIRVAPILAQVLEAERLARGLPSSHPALVNLQVNQTNNERTEYTFVQRMIRDPDFARDATSLLGRLSDVGESEPGRIGPAG